MWLGIPAPAVIFENGQLFGLSGITNLCQVRICFVIIINILNT